MLAEGGDGGEMLIGIVDAGNDGATQEDGSTVTIGCIEVFENYLVGSAGIGGVHFGAGEFVIVQQHVDKGQ